jgi:hypothetical protein
MGTEIAFPRGVEALPKAKPAPPGTTPKLAEELARVPQETFLPVERQLVAWSVILGVALLGGLVWVSSTFFPG